MTASETITRTVTSWPGVEAGTGSRGEFGFTVGRRQIGHLHGDHAAHFSFPKAVWAELYEQGRIDYHPVFPGRAGHASRRIADEADVRDVIALLRLNYERAVGRQGLPGLRAGDPQPLPFAPSLHIRTFVLEREAGDVAIYGPQPEVGRAYLGHWHEAMFATHVPGVPLFVHEAERGHTERHLPVRATFTRRHRLDEDLEIIPMPGHTRGATAFLWSGGGHRYLFTGDTIYLRDGEWIAAMLDSSDRPAYLESLALLRELDFDVLVPWAASAGDAHYALTDAGDRRQRLDAIIERLRNGSDH